MLAASSDIGAHLASNFLRSGAAVAGTFRTHTPQVEALEKAGARLFHLDIGSNEQVKSFAKTLNECAFQWNIFISTAGVLDPIGGFFTTDFDAWEKSFITNSIAQLRVLHAIYSLRDQSRSAKVIFFAGGGTNGTFDNFSAYCAGKLTLIKMTELLDSECSDLDVSIIGTGWVNTKFHLQTLAAGAAAGLSLGKTQSFLKRTEGDGNTLVAVAECVDWCLNSPRSAVGGRNIALVNDPWRSTDFIEMLSADSNRFKLRRHS